VCLCIALLPADVVWNQSSKVFFANPEVIVATPEDLNDVEVCER
jgi:hypothetical protein